MRTIISSTSSISSTYPLSTCCKTCERSADGVCHRIKLDDDPNEVLLKHFSDTNAFIDNALSNGGAVFVHCAMGKSRSATIVCAYLMYKYGVSPEAALKQLCEGREVCDPNPGFKEQLKVYHTMLQTKDNAEQQGIFQKWLDTRYTGTWYSGTYW
jgi:dual specificity phosphatase 12